MWGCDMQNNLSQQSKEKRLPSLLHYTYSMNLPINIYVDKYRSHREYFYLGKLYSNSKLPCSYKNSPNINRLISRVINVILINFLPLIIIHSCWKSSKTAEEIEL